MVLGGRNVLRIEVPLGEERGQRQVRGEQDLKNWE